MAARAALYELVSTDEELGLEATYPTNAVDTPAEEFFAIIRWGGNTRSFETTGTDRVQIWVHDRQRDYGRINAALRRLKDLLPGVLNRAGEDGEVLVQAEWNGESDDFFDEGYQTCTRYAEFTAVSRYASA